ncbi:MAG: DbpA RNA binding domain-containing protein [Chthoniobacteraceae bacterium]
MTRLLFSVGREHQINPGDVVGVIAGVARIPKEAIGAIQFSARHSLVDVADEHAKLVMKKLNGIKFKGLKLQVRRAT